MIMSNMRILIKFFSSLRLTVLLLVLSMILIFVMTLEQPSMGIYYSKVKYFYGLFVWWPFGSVSLPVFPSGTTLSVLLFINLLVAHIYRFKWTWKKSGIWLTHVGLLVLLAGAGFTQWFAVESQMQIREGESAIYSESLRDIELAIVKLGESKDTVVAIPNEYLQKGQIIAHPELPMSIRVLDIFPNSRVTLRQPSDPDHIVPVNKGLGLRLSSRPLPLYQSDTLRNIQTVYLELLDSDEMSLGIWMVSNALPPMQRVSVDGSEFRFQLRQTRFYNDYVMTLRDFTHDVYPGSDIPKDFSSMVHVTDMSDGSERDVRIYMNHPFRYKGKTYYQASFGEENTLSVLQVVENPSWIFPYVSSLIMSLGLVIQFSIHLSRFIKRQKL